MPSQTTPFLSLIENDKRAFVEIATTVPSYAPAAYDAFVRGCRAASALLPEAVSIWVHQVKTGDLGLLRNLPIDVSLPTVPVDRETPVPDTPLANSVLGLICALFGSIYTIAGKNVTRHIQDISPLKGDQDTQLASSQAELDWHVEDALHPHRAHWVALLCLRGDPAVFTSLARSQDMKFDRDVDMLLRQKRFMVALDDTFAGRDQTSAVPTSILAGSRSRPLIVFDPAYTVCRDDTDRFAVSHVRAAARRVSRDLSLEAGDLVIFNNRTVVHARSSHKARMDGRDRWLKRALVLEPHETLHVPLGGVINLAIDHA